jgi:hypothetical protein
LAQVHPNLSGMNIDRTIAEIEWLERIFAGAGHQTAERERPLGCESKTRRHARAQPMVSALAALWSLLPT